MVHVNPEQLQTSLLTPRPKQHTFSLLLWLLLPFSLACMGKKGPFLINNNWGDMQRACVQSISHCHLSDSLYRVQLWLPTFFQQPWFQNYLPIHFLHRHSRKFFSRVLRFQSTIQTVKAKQYLKWKLNKSTVLHT